MAHPWTNNELSILNTIGDGQAFQLLKELLPTRTDEAIKKMARDFNWATKTINGNILMKHGVNRRRGRQRTNQIVDAIVPIETTITIVGEPRTVPPVQEPTTSERTNQYFTDDSIAELAVEPLNGFQANLLATKILVDVGLPIEPDIICTLSKYILLHKSGISGIVHENRESTPNIKAVI